MHQRDSKRLGKVEWNTWLINGVSSSDLITVDEWGRFDATVAVSRRS